MNGNEKDGSGSFSKVVGKNLAADDGTRGERETRITKRRGPICMPGKPRVSSVKSPPLVRDCISSRSGTKVYRRRKVQEKRGTILSDSLDFRIGRGEGASSRLILFSFRTLSTHGRRSNWLSVEGIGKVECHGIYKHLDISRLFVLIRFEMCVCVCVLAI